MKSKIDKEEEEEEEDGVGCRELSIDRREREECLCLEEGKRQPPRQTDAIEYDVLVRK